MNATLTDDHGTASDLPVLSQQHAEAVVRVVETALAVRRRHQYFVWTQSQVHALLPHQLLVCGAYLRQRRGLVFEVFQSIVLPPALLATLTDAQGPLLGHIVAAWVSGGGQPLRLSTSQMLDPGLSGAVADLRASGIETFVAHGVARPQRPSEIESFFLFASRDLLVPVSALAHLELLLPYLHWSWQRVLATERDLAPPQPQPRPAEVVASPSAAVETPAKRVTLREREVLERVREGKSNQQIAQALGISPLTVKNHVQKILRRLGANNRTQAVAEAMALGLLPMAPPTGTPRP